MVWFSAATIGLNFMFNASSNSINYSCTLKIYPSTVFLPAQLSLTNWVAVTWNRPLLTGHFLGPATWYGNLVVVMIGKMWIALAHMNNCCNDATE